MEQNDLSGGGILVQLASGLPALTNLERLVITDEWQTEESDEWRCGDFRLVTRTLSAV